MVAALRVIRWLVLLLACTSSCVVCSVVFLCLWVWSFVDLGLVGCGGCVKGYSMASVVVGLY